MTIKHYPVPPDTTKYQTTEQDKFDGPDERETLVVCEIKAILEAVTGKAHVLFQITQWRLARATRVNRQGFFLCFICSRATTLNERDDQLGTVIAGVTKKKCFVASRNESFIPGGTPTINFIVLFC